MTLFPHRPAVFCLLCTLLWFFHSAAVVCAQDISATWASDAIGLDAIWNNGANWSTSPDFPNDSDTKSYAVSLNTGVQVYLNQDITVNRLTLGDQNYGVIGLALGPSTLNVRSELVVNKGSLTVLDSNTHGNVNALGTVLLSGTLYVSAWQVSLSGTTTWSGTLLLGNNAVITNQPGATIALSNGATASYFLPSAGSRTLDNYGAIEAAGGDHPITLDVNLNNYGLLDVQSGTVVVKDGGSNSGIVNIAAGAQLDFEPSNIPTRPDFVFAETSSVSGEGSVMFSGSNFQVNGEFNMSGVTTVGEANVTFNAPITSIGHDLVVNGQFANLDLGTNSVAVATLTLEQGSLTGQGTIEVAGLLEWKDGQMTGSGMTNARSGVFFNGLNTSSGFDILDRTLNCFGTSQVQTSSPYRGNLNFDPNAALNIMPGAKFNGSRLAISGSDIGGQLWGEIRNYGTLIVDDPGLNRGMAAFGTSLLNDGRIEVTNSSLDIRTTGNDPGLIQDIGEIVLSNGSVGESLQLNGGTLKGFGGVGNLVGNPRIEPAGGDLDFNQGILALQSESVLSCNINLDKQKNSVGRIVNVSNASLDGTLQINLIGKPNKKNLRQPITIVAAGAINGHFSNAANGQRIMTQDGQGSFLVSYSPTAVVLSNFKPNAFKRGRPNR